jgi:DNA (cytosine-5)-methyltransferase 1
MRIVDLFAGCGGLSKGFEDAGHHILAAFDYWDVAIDCYKINFSHPINKADLSQPDIIIPNIRNYNPEMIIGGPPCQDFSHAGKRSEGDRANLTISFAEIVKSVQPRWFVMENVDRASSSSSYEKAKKIFKNAGYGLTERILNAAYCGAPQNRKRFFCIGLMGATDGFLSQIIDQNLRSEPMTVRGYLGNELGVEYYYRHPRNYSRRGIFSIDEPAPTVRGVNRPVPKGYTGHPTDPVPVSENLRSLTTLERARLQTFPASFKWVGSKTDLEQMIGNAVPVKLAEFVAKMIILYKRQNEGTFEEECDLAQIGFEEWLSQKGMGKASVGDVISRLKRAERYVDLSKMDDLEYLLFEVGRNQDFAKLSMSVKSQIKRAIKLKSEYQQSFSN